MSPDIWKEETVWTFKANKHWPEPTMDVPETTAQGKPTSPLIRVSGMKYSMRGGYGKQCLSPKLPDKLAKVMVEAANHSLADITCHQIKHCCI